MSKDIETTEERNAKIVPELFLEDGRPATVGDVDRIAHKLLESYVDKNSIPKRGLPYENICSRVLIVDYDENNSPILRPANGMDLQYISEEFWQFFFFGDERDTLVQ